MRHAYLITIHKDFRILELFIRTLERKGNDFFILIDKKTGLSLADVCSYIPKDSKIIEVTSIPVNWGSFSLINSELKLLKEAVKGKYDYYHYMQGADFPIKTEKEINEFFKNHQGMNFIDFEPLNYEFAKFKCDYWHMFVENPWYRTSKILKFFNHGFVKIQKMLHINRHDRELFHGSGLCSITHECAMYIVGIMSDITQRYKYCLAADEVFLQTEIYHSKFKDTLYKNGNRYSNARFIDWEHRQGSSPYTFKKDDFELLMNKNDAMFARKFDENNFGIVKMLYQYLKLGKEY